MLGIVTQGVEYNGSVVVYDYKSRLVEREWGMETNLELPCSDRGLRSQKS